MFSGKRLFILGFLVVLLVAIPLTIYLAGQQQKTNSSAQAATVMTLSTTTPSVQVGDPVPIALTISPGTNSVAYAKIVINYDSAKFSVATSAFTPQQNGAMSFFGNPAAAVTQTDGSITIQLSTGGTTGNPLGGLTTNQVVGTFNLVAKESTDSLPTPITIVKDQSLANSVGPGEQQLDDVLDSVNGTSVTITDAASVLTPTPTETLTLTPTPTAAQANQAPTCTGLTVSGLATDSAAPVTVTFTGAGNDADGTITKATFNFGDGAVQDLTQDGGLGSASVNIETTHDYAAGGNFTASLVLTDNNGAQSSSTTCVQSVAISGNGSTTATNDEITATSAPQPTLVQTGPGQTILVAGAFGGILSVVGVILLFAL